MRTEYRVLCIVTGMGITGMNESREFLGRLQAGDIAAVGELLEAHLPHLRAYVRLRAGRFVLRREAVSDILQSTCREVLETADKIEYRTEPEFRNWLYKASLRKLIKKHRFHRAAKRDALRERPQASDADARDEDLPLWDLFTPSRHAEAREALDRLAEAIEALNDSDREVFAMYRVLGMSSDEIANETGKTSQAIRKQKSRILTRLSRVLADD